MKNYGLMNKYNIVKLENPLKQINAIVLEFDDPIAQVGIDAWKDEMRAKGYDKCADDVELELASHGYNPMTNSMPKKNLEPRIEEYESKLNAERERFESLAQLVWDNFLAKDSNGKTGEGRDVSETTEVWGKYHKLCSRRKGNKDE